MNGRGLFCVIFASLTVFSVTVNANQTIYACKANGQKVVFQNTPCKEGSLIGTRLYYSSEKSGQEKITQPLNNGIVQSQAYDVEQALKQAELKHQLELDEVKRALDNAKLEAEESARVATEEAEEQAREAEERTRAAAEEAEQLAADIRNEMIRSAIKTKNNLYLGGLLLLVGGFVTYIIKRTNKEKLMNENQKYGVVTMIVSFLLILLVLMISDGWVPQLDYLENLMNNLNIQRIWFHTDAVWDSKSMSYLHPESYDYLIDVSSKYVVLALLAIGAYGFTTYLEITPAIRPWTRFKAK